MTSVHATPVGWSERLLGGVGSTCKCAVQQNNLHALLNFKGILVCLSASTKRDGGGGQ